MKLYPKIDLHVDGFYWTTTQRYPTLSKALQALKSQAPAYIQSGQPSRFLEASFPDSGGSRRIKIYENRKKKTRKRIVRRKRRVVRRNPAKGVWSHVPFIRLSNSRTGKKIKTYPLDSLKWTARERSDIKTLMEVGGKAIQIGDFVYEKRNALARARSNAWPRNALGMTITPANYSGLRGNPYITKDDGQRVLYGYAKNDMRLLGTGLKISKGNLVLLTPATNIPGGGYFARPGYPTGLWKQLSEEVASIFIKPSDFKNDITFKKPVFGSKSFERMIRANSGGRYRVGGGYQTFTFEEAKKEADKIFRKTGAIVSITEHKPTPQVKPDYKYGIYTGRGIARNPSQYQNELLRLKRADARGYAFTKKFSSKQPQALDMLISKLSMLKGNRDEMLVTFLIRKRAKYPRDYIVILKHRKYVDGARVYSAGQKAEGAIGQFATILGAKAKRVGQSDFVFTTYGIRFPEERKKSSPGKLFGNSGGRYRVGGGYQTFTLEEAKKEADKIFRKTGAIVSIQEHRPTPQVKPDYKYGIYTGRGIARNPMRRTVSKVGLIQFIEDTYYNDKILAENKRWLNRILGKIRKLKPGVYDIQTVQNMLRDLRDDDPADDDNYWYLIIDTIKNATGIAPE